VSRKVRGNDEVSPVVGLAVVDRDTGAIRSVDERWERQFGVASDAAVGRPLEVFVEEVTTDSGEQPAFGPLWSAVSAGERERAGLTLAVSEPAAAAPFVQVDLTTGRTDDVVVATSRVALADGAGPDSRDGGPLDGQLYAPSEHYRELVENFPNGLVTRFDEDLRYTLAGGALFEDLSIDPEDVEGRTLPDVFPDENVEQLEPLYRAALEGEPGVTEVTYEGRTVRILVRPVHDEDDDVVGGLTISQDVTELREHEAELEAARKRYETLVEAAPDAILVADPSTGEIREANEAAEALLGASREDVVGRHQSDLHPPDETDRYRRLFERHVEQEGTVERFENGDLVEVVTDDGERVPVAISVRTVDLDDRTVVYGIFRDASERHEHQQTLAELHDWTRTVLQTRSRSAISQQVVAALEDLLEHPAACLYRFDEDDGVLRPDASSERVADLVGTPPVFRPGEALAWEAFVEGETVVYDDIRANDTLHNPETDIRSEILAPLGDYGILVLASPRSGAFDERVRELVDIVAETATAAFEQIDRDERLRQRDNELNQQLQHLERLEDINGRVRDFSRTLMECDSRREIEERICAHLAESDPFAFAWVGDPDPIEGTLVPRAWAGEASEYLDQISRSLADAEESDDLEPAVRTAVTGERTLERRVARDVAADSWRNQLVMRGFLSAMSVPLVYDEVFYGVLTVYARESAAFDGMFQSVMSDLSDGVAYAINATYRKHALSSDQVQEFEFALEDEGCFFVQFAQTTGAPIEFEGMVPDDDGSAAVFAEIHDFPAEEVLAYADRATAVEAATLIEDGDGWVRLRFQVRDAFIGTTLADYGISLQSIEADTRESRVTVTCPPTIEPRRVQTVMQSVFPESELLAKREQVQPNANARGLEERYLADLTERQRDVVTRAYRDGYFESPKRASGAELADEMGISPSAFHDNLRAAERKLLATIVENSAGFDS
jgi:PAS domain S-box-containing protein